MYQVFLQGEKTEEEFTWVRFGLSFHVYLAPVEAQPRLLAVCEHLPQGDSKHPRVCGVGERPGLQTLWSAPETPHNQEENQEAV